jgi:ATP-binding cassette subfamily B protein
MLLASFALSQLAALPTRWPRLAQAARRGAAARRPAAPRRHGRWPWADRDRDLVPADVSTRVQRRFRDKVTIALEAHVARLQAGSPPSPTRSGPNTSTASPSCATRSSCSTTCTCRSSRPAAGSCAWRGDRALHVDPSRARAPGRVRAAHRVHVVVAARRRARGRGARRPASRLARHLFATADDGAAGQGGARHAHRGPPRPGAARGLGALVRARWPPLRGTSAAWHALAWAIFGAAYVGAIVFVSSALKGARGRRAARARGGRALSATIGATVGEIGFLRGIWLDGSAPPGLARGLRGVGRWPRRTSPRPSGSREGIPLKGRVVRVIPARIGSCWSPSISTCPRARWSRSSARTARARARS